MESTIGAGIFLFIAMLTGLPTVSLTLRKESIPSANYLWVSVGVVGFIICMGWLG